MNERRVLLASLLSVICITLYSQALMKNSKGLVKPASTVVASQASVPAAAVEFLELPDEDTVFMESKALKIEIGKSSGAVRSVVLKKFLNSTKSAPLQLRPKTALISLQDGKGNYKVTDVQVSGLKTSISLIGNTNEQVKVSYELDQETPVLRTSLITPTSSTGLNLSASWMRGDELANRQNRLEAYVIEPDSGKIRYHHFSTPWKGEKNVPRGTLFALADRHFCLVAKAPSVWQGVQLHTYGTQGIVARVPLAQSTEAVSIYFGARDFFQLRTVGFEKAFPIGILGQIGLILLALLNWLEGFTHNYGIAIILFSVLVTGAMSPFTLLSYRSMRRMQELKPQVDKIMAEHKSDPQKANKEVFALYKENKVSPLGGCLPMLLQMPIFIALFQAISHFVNLRGATFIGIKDLSLPDQMIHLPFRVPLVGNMVNLLPVIMAVAMYFQTRASQKNMGATADNPTAQMMSGPVMPVMFLFMFYQFPAGLVLYWLTNSVMSALISRVANK